MTRSLRKGDSGQEVRRLQEALTKIRQGPRLIVSGNFDPMTYHAVRAFQCSHGLLIDGIAGPKTMRVLGIGQSSVLQAAVRDNSFADNIADLVQRIGGFIIGAAMRAAVVGIGLDFALPVGRLRTSDKGLRFIFTHEAEPRNSDRLNWDGGGSSGVTLGPGYDMGERTPKEIEKDMEALGLDHGIAQNVAKTAGLKGTKASEFVEKNKQIVNLTDKQQEQLLTHIVPDYEAIVRRHMTVHLHQHQFDALVSFAYNPGEKFASVAEPINDGRVADAMATMRSRVTSGGEKFPGLVNRRRDEVNLYLYGDYGRLVP